MASSDLLPVSGALAPRAPAPDVYTHTDALAERHGAVNLGRGAPDFDGPAVLRRAATAAMRAGVNQYVASAGHPELLETLGALAVPEGTRYDPRTEITVTAGATEALATALETLLRPGDEVLVLEPFYDSYPALVRRAGGVPVAVPLVRRGSGYVLDADAVSAAVTGRTRVLLLNTPHNPTGWVASAGELESLAALVLRHGLYVVCDEVYEQLVHGTGQDDRHRSIASLPGLRERTVVCSGAAKSLSVCGWRVGWAFAPKELSGPLRDAHRMLSYCAPAPLQLGVAAGLAWAHRTGWFGLQRQEYRARRAALLAGLEAAGLCPVTPSGGFMIMASTGPDLPADPLRANELLARDFGVTGLPLPGFHVRPESASGLLRFAFCKELGVLQEAARRLSALAPATEKGTLPA
ncbi:aminotransferase class I/II-fold pyridoxal phosphate-dependent enzyme [Streptomyces sp. NBC_01013]|uniref:aminotransferase class I/II-fold pyridoxal phosphate-dependent enzyme n=1 Tax=Streptomyces sp. NBC_01013 TaxID=2903718 RepID=UPI00386CA89D|nr:aminotransferase class I/II-fold pyridoxal phosphate-dependent enzyme [Streptomyces sp. NBC_01013]